MKTSVYKVIVIGNSSVGKTAFVKSYVFNKPHLGNSATVGVEFVVKTIELPNNVQVKLQVWDIGGQDRSIFLMRAFCNRAHGCVVLFDVTNQDTFASLAGWKRELEEKCLTDGRKPIPCILLANKCDLDERRVKLKDIDKMTDELGFIGWKEISVKDGLNIQEAMMSLVEAMVSRNGESSESENESNNGNLQLSQRIVKKSEDIPLKWKNNCC